MAKYAHALAAVAAAASLPALASVTVVGDTAARTCFEAADSQLPPTLRQIARCNEALRSERLTEYEVVATHVNRGILHLRRGRIDQAVADFDRAIALDPNQPESYLNKGAALIRQNDPQNAVSLFTVALERNTRRPAIALYGRAMAHETLGNVRQAYNDYRRAAELAPEWEEPRTDLQRFRVVDR